MARLGMLWRMGGRDSRSTISRRRRAELSRELFEHQYGVASRRQLYAAGLGRWDIKAELRSGRWSKRGPQSISNVTGELGERGRWWNALIEVGSRAALDGVTALQAAGLTGFAEPSIHISVPKSARPRRWPGVVVHESRRRLPADLASVGIPRVRPAAAAVRAALWATSDRQAALVLTMATQQRLVTVAALTEAMAAVRRHRRRRFLLQVLADLQGGVQSMAELDFARLCRTAGLPEPDRQVVHDLGDGWAVVDNEWTRYDLVVEIEGVHHLHGPVAIADALRQNSLTTQRSAVLRIPVLGLRTQPARFLDQVRTALIARGWRPTGSLASEEAGVPLARSSDVSV